MGRQKKYRDFGKKVLAGASSGIVAGMFLMGTGSTAYADTEVFQAPTYTQNIGKGMHTMHHFNSKSKINSVAGTLGLDPMDLESDLSSGKSMKQILRENGVDPSHVGKAFHHKGKMKEKGWRKNADHMYN